MWPDTWQNAEYLVEFAAVRDLDAALICECYHCSSAARPPVFISSCKQSVYTQKSHCCGVFCFTNFILSWNLRVLGGEHVCGALGCMTFLDDRGGKIGGVSVFL